MRKLSIFLAFILVLATGQVFAQCEMVVDHVQGTWTEGANTYLNTGITGEFFFRARVTCGATSGWYNPGNAFEVYSPDGATYTYINGIGEDGNFFSLGFNQALFVNQFIHNDPLAPHPSGFVRTADSLLGTLTVTKAPQQAATDDGRCATYFAGASSAGPGFFPGMDAVVYGIEFLTSEADSGLHLCVDTTTVPGSSWMWAKAGGNVVPAWYAEPYCLEMRPMPNEPPQPATSTTNYPGSHCVTATASMVFDEAEHEPPYTFEIVGGGPGVVTTSGGNTAVWTWNTLPQEGFATVVIRGREDGMPDHWGGEWTINVVISNDGPVITACPTTVPTVQVGTSASLTVVATDDCDALTWEVVSTTLPGGVGDVAVVGGVVTVSPSVGPAGVYNVVVSATDGLETVECTLQVSVIVGAPYSVTIEKLHTQLQGHFADVALTLDGIDANEGLGGFDLLIAYDNSALSFQLAYEGDIYTECGWEYFTYRFGADGNCGNGCPSGLTRIIGLAETNNGPHHPGCEPTLVPGDENVTLAYLRFLVSNDRTLECQYVPIRFFWIDCGDNTLSNVSGSQLFISAQVFDYDNTTPINNGTFGFPTFLGAQDFCLEQALPNKPLPKRYVDFYNGGVDIACADSIDARGDINLNGIAYEIADAVMFTNYFIEGLSAFGVYYEGAIAASDANADGLPVTVADLVYLIRVVVGDALPYPKTTVDASYSFENGIVSVNSEMGAAVMTFEGTVTPTLLASQMDMRYAVVDGNTRVIVYPKVKAPASFTGNFVEVKGQLVDIELATFDGQMVASKELPKNFKVYQNYPNPFNPTTTVAFAMPTAGDWKVVFYNVTGQQVDVRTGNDDAGQVSFEWNAGDLASGVYFYKVSAGSNVETKKAVLLK